MLRTHLGWLAAAALAAGCVLNIDDFSDAHLTIHNESSRVITEVRLSDGWNGGWGPNLLWTDLAPGHDARSMHIACGDYDVLVVDAAGHGCQVDRLYLCWDDRDWVIDDGMMSGC